MSKKDRPGKVRCSVESCQQAVFACNYCKRHYQKWHTYGDPLSGRTNKKNSGGCLVEDCINVHCALGYCEKHYKRVRSHGDPTADGRRTVVDGLLRCGRCNLNKLINEFTLNRSQPTGFSIYCKPCRRSIDMFQNFGLTEQRFQDLLIAQENQCAICCTIEPHLGQWHVDHDHSCCPGKRSCGNCVRGILCLQCNLSLGGFRDDIKTLQRASVYLEKWVEIQGPRSS